MSPMTWPSEVEAALGLLVKRDASGRDEACMALLEGLDRIAASREDVVALLRPAIASLSYHQDIRKILGWLVRKGPREGMEEVLAEFLHHPDPNCRDEVPPFLAKLDKEAAGPILLALLEKDLARQVAAATMSACLALGLPPRKLFVALEGNPSQEAVKGALMVLTRDPLGIRALRDGWPQLPMRRQARYRDLLSDAFLEELGQAYFYCLDWRHYQRGGRPRDRPEDEYLLFDFPDRHAFWGL